MKMTRAVQVSSDYESINHQTFSFDCLTSICLSSGLKYTHKPVISCCMLYTHAYTPTTSAWWHLLQHAVNLRWHAQNSIVGSGKRLIQAKENTNWQGLVRHIFFHTIPNPAPFLSSNLPSFYLSVRSLAPQIQPDLASFSSSPLAIPDSPPVMFHPPLQFLLPSPHPHVPACSCRLPVASPTDSLWRWGWWGCTWRWGIYGWSPFQMAGHKISSLPALLHWDQSHVSAS